MNHAWQQIFKIYFPAILIIIFWASAYIGIRAALVDYSPGSLALLRYLVASFCMLIIFVVNRHIDKTISLADLLQTAVLGFFGFTLYSVFLNYGEKTVNAGIASFIVSQIPVILTLLGIVFLKERLQLSAWIGTLLSLVGLVFIAIGETTTEYFDWGVIYVLVTTFSGAIYSFFQKFLLRRVHPILFTSVAIWSGTFFMLVYLPELAHDLPHASLSATLWVIYIGIFPGAIAFLVWSYMMKKIPASKAASYLYAVPFVSTLMSWWLLSETPTLLAVIGGTVALFGAFLVNRGVVENDS